MLVKVPNFYRPPSTSKSVFIDELEDRLTSDDLGPSEKLILCGDVNMPGVDLASVDNQLTTLLDVHGYAQHVIKTTRYNSTMTSTKILDVVITKASRVPPLVSNVSVHTSHGLSDHSIVTFECSVRRQTMAEPSRSSSSRNIKADYGRRPSSLTHLRHLISTLID